MENPRTGAIPKRDESAKGKKRTLQGFHPITFVALWTSSYFVASVFSFIIVIVASMTLQRIDFIRDFERWMYRVDVEWLVWVIPCVVMGYITAVAQKWLMKQQGLESIRHWILFTSVSAGIAAFGFGQFVDYPTEGAETIMALLAWFAVPSLAQSVLMSRVMRGGWLWLGGGLVASVIGYFIYSQTEYIYDVTSTLYIYTGIAYNIIMATIFLLLRAQQNRLAIKN